MSKMQLNEGPLVVWVDIETTGLDEKSGLPLELGLLITDISLDEVARFSHIIQWGNLDWGGVISQYVTDMHAASGLMAEYNSGMGSAVRQVEDAAIAFLEAHDALKYPMAGSNVANFDRRWIAEFMPALNDAFHYRNQDISSAKEMCRRWNPEVYAKLPDKVEKHRVIPDCLDTVEEFRFYRDSFLFTTR